MEKVGLAGLSLAPVVQGHPNPWATLRIPDLQNPSNPESITPKSVQAEIGVNDDLQVVHKAHGKCIRAAA